MTKLICSDFDHTIFFRDNEALTTQNYTAIKNWRAANNLCAVSTNRSFSSLKRQLPNYQDYFDYLILDSGSLIAHPDGETIERAFFNQEAVKALQDITATLPEKPVITYSSDAKNDNYSYVPFEKNTKIRCWFQNPKIAQTALGYIRKISHKSLIIDVEQLTDQKTILKNKKVFIEVIPKDSGKNIGVLKLAKTLNINHQNIITIGDGANDYEMIKDFDGYVIKGSLLAKDHPEFKTVDSLAELITNNL